MASDDEQSKLMEDHGSSTKSTFGEEKGDHVFHEAKEDIEEQMPQSDFLGSVRARGMMQMMLALFLVGAALIGGSVWVFVEAGATNGGAIALLFSGAVVALILLFIPARFEFYIGKLRFRFGPLGFWGFGPYWDFAGSQFSGRVEEITNSCSQAGINCGSLSTGLLLIRPHRMPLRISPADHELFKTLLRQATRPW
ncbi:MAG: hypothetical protein Q8P67_18700 [archaeon]|nr:hypothetical protein [archaeon]